MATKSPQPASSASARLGTYVQRLRHERNLSLRALAARAGVDLAWLSRLENGRIASPDARLLWRIARALNTEVADLYLEAGFGDARGLPGFAPYLRAKYHLSDQAIAELEAHFERFNQPDTTHQQENPDAPQDPQ
jgi:transcriptional regulator with XRE-family HTH domain